MEKLYISLMFSKLVVTKPLITIITLMHNFIVKFAQILEIYKNFKKRIETLFSQLNEQFMMIRNYAKKPTGLFTRPAAKIAALTVLQYVNFVNPRRINQVNYALI